jgi:SAM-dependent methyltransferase
MAVPYVYQLDRILLDEQLEQCAHHITGRVLDVGSGTRNRYQRRFKTLQYIRLDLEPGPDVDIVASADALPVGDAEFDAVVSMQVFHLLKNPDKAAQEIHRVLKKGGTALITIPQWAESHNEPHDYWRFTKHGIAELFERNGFETIECHQRGGFYTNIAQMRMRYLIDRYHPYNRPITGRILSRLFRLYGTYARLRDAYDTSAANRKHTIGWCCVFRRR